MFICPLSHRKVSAIADGEGLPQYKLYYFLKSANQQTQKEPLPTKEKRLFSYSHPAMLALPRSTFHHTRAPPAVRTHNK